MGRETTENKKRAIGYYQKPFDIAGTEGQNRTAATLADIIILILKTWFFSSALKIPNIGCHKKEVNVETNYKTFSLIGVSGRSLVY